MMKKSLFVLGLALCLMFVLSACGGDSKSSEPAVAPTGVTEEVTITAKNFEFSPAEIKVKKGDTIKLTFNSEEGVHGLMIKDFDINMDESGTKEFVADKVGTFDFNCSIMCGGGHGQMVGKITVE
ncbi:cupredoxin domain-containing protein [Paenibacillus terrigena]|nr:cupredoxin domain-containing protein [Paenibacillus terrigena]